MALTPDRAKTRELLRLDRRLLEIYVSRGRNITSFQAAAARYGVKRSPSSRSVSATGSPAEDPRGRLCVADQLSADAITDADAKLRQERFSAKAKAVREATYAAASDTRAGMIAEAEQRHRDRLAAIQRHFGQQVMSRGDPDADHALAFIETVADPVGCIRRNRPRRRSAGLSRSRATGSSTGFASTPTVASLPSALSPMTDGRPAAHLPVTPKPSWRPREPALG